jgi:hypothetical protein
MNKYDQIVADVNAGNLAEPTRELVEKLGRFVETAE